MSFNNVNKERGLAGRWGTGCGVLFVEGKLWLHCLQVLEVNSTTLQAMVFSLFYSRFRALARPEPWQACSCGLVNKVVTGDPGKECSKEPTGGPGPAGPFHTVIPTGTWGHGCTETKKVDGGRVWLLLTQFTTALSVRTGPSADITDPRARRARLPKRARRNQLQAQSSWNTTEKLKQPLQTQHFHLLTKPGPELWGAYSELWGASGSPKTPDCPAHAATEVFSEVGRIGAKPCQRK